MAANIGPKRLVVGAHYGLRDWLAQRVTAVVMAVYAVLLGIYAVFVLPPGSQIGPITPEQRKALIAGSLVAGVYEKTVDRESAYEKLKGRAAQSADAAQDMAAEAERAAKTPRTLPGKASQQAPQDEGGGLLGGLKDVLFGSTGPRGGKREGLAETAAKSAMRSVGSAVGREIIRGVLGGILGGGSRRR